MKAFFCVVLAIATASAEPQYYAGGQINPVYTDGQFHTNAANLQKGIHNNKVSPFGTVYNAYTPTNKGVFAANPLASVYAKPAVYAAQPSVLGYSSPLVHALGKREAEPEHHLYAGQINPVYTDGQFHTNAANLQKGIHNNKVSPFGTIYNAYTPNNKAVYAASPLASVYAKPTVYAAQPTIYAAQPSALGYNSPLVHALGKREAESEPEADPAFITSYANPLLGQTGYTYASPLASTYIKPAVTYSGYAQPAVYAAQPSVFGYSNGLVHALGKREAEAEPESDPAVIYPGLGYLSPYTSPLRPTYINPALTSYSSWTPRSGVDQYFNRLNRFYL